MSKPRASVLRDAEGVVETDANSLTVQELKSALTRRGHNLPPNTQNKQTYVDLYKKHVIEPAKAAAKKNGGVSSGKTNATKALKSNKDCCGLGFLFTILILQFAAFAVAGCFLWQSEMSAPDSCYTLGRPYFDRAWNVSQPYVDHAWKIVKPYVDQAWTVIKPYVDLACKTLTPYVELAWSHIQPVLAKVNAFLAPYIAQARPVVERYFKLAVKYVTEYGKLATKYTRQYALLAIKYGNEYYKIAYERVQELIRTYVK